MNTNTQFWFTTLDLIFDFWPMLLIGAIPKRGRFGRTLKLVIITWGFWAVVRIGLFFNPEPLQASLLIHEPLNTVLFFLTGPALIALYLGISRLQQGKLIKKSRQAQGIEDLLELSPAEFEDLTVAIFQAAGHRARRTGKSGDHGVDVVVTLKSGEKCVVQCKRWRGYVGEPVVRDLYGAMQHEKAARAVVVTTGKFSKPAREWAKGKPILLYDGDRVLAQVRKMRKAN